MMSINLSDIGILNIDPKKAGGQFVTHFPFFRMYLLKRERNIVFLCDF